MQRGKANVAHCGCGRANTKTRRDLQRRRLPTGFLALAEMCGDPSFPHRFRPAVNSVGATQVRNRVTEFAGPFLEKKITFEEKRQYGHPEPNRVARNQCCSPRRPRYTTSCTLESSSDPILLPLGTLHGMRFQSREPGSPRSGPLRWP